MKSNLPPSFLIRLVSRSVRYYLLFVVGLVIAYLCSIALGTLPTFLLLMPSLGELLWRVAILILCLGAIAVVAESARY